MAGFGTELCCWAPFLGVMDRFERDANGRPGLPCAALLEVCHGAKRGAGLGGKRSQ